MVWITTDYITMLCTYWLTAEQFLVWRWNRHYSRSIRKTHRTNILPMRNVRCMVFYIHALYHHEYMMIIIMHVYTHFLCYFSKILYLYRWPYFRCSPACYYQRYNVSLKCFYLFYLTWKCKWIFNNSCMCNIYIWSYYINYRASGVSF